MGTKTKSATEITTIPTTQSSLRSRLKKLSKDLEQATGQTLQLKAQLEQSDKKVSVLNSIVRSLRKELQQGNASPLSLLSKSGSNETLCSETPDTRSGGQEFETQVRGLQLQRDQERQKAASLEMELFEVLELMEKSFPTNAVLFIDAHYCSHP